MKVCTKISIFLAIFVSIESKYEIINDRIELPMGDEDQIFALHSCRIKKFNRSATVLSGVMEFKIPIDDSYILSFEAFNFAGGQYKKLFGRELGPACQVTYEKSIESECRRVYASSNISISYGDCPFPAGFVNFNDYYPNDLGDYLPPYVPGSERWKVTTWVSKNGTTIGGMTFYSIVRDNQKLIDSKFG